jgi:hypothetical protein
MICARAMSEHIGRGQKIEVRDQKPDVAEKYAISHPRRGVAVELGVAGLRVVLD